MKPRLDSSHHLRLTRRVFWDLAIFMIGLGLLTGVIFPPFVVLLGMPKESAYGLTFVLSCLTAGFLVGAANHRLARAVVGRRLRVLSDRLRHADTMIRLATSTGDWSRCSPEECNLPVDSDDELGETAASFNHLLDALDQLRRFQTLVQKSSDLISVVDPDGTIRYQSPSAEHILGFPAADLIGRAMQDLFHPEETALMAAHLAELGSASDRSGRVFTGRVRHRDGSWRHVEAVGVNLLLDQQVRGFLFTTRDVTDRRELEEQLRHQALHDPLTGLANRALLHDRLKHALARRESSLLAVLLLDVDDFKTINDSLGHSVGDELLVAAAKRIQGCLRPADTAARLGGDEFAVLLEDLGNDGQATAVAERILNALQQPFTLRQGEAPIRASVGICLAGDAESRGEDILRNADVAMYAAKRAGKGRYALFHQSMHTDAVKRLEVEADLRRGIDAGELTLLYQPVVDLATGRVVGAEALVRWDHPLRGRLSPADFIGIAEETGLVVPLGRWVITQACRQASAWQRRHQMDPPLRIGVNLSPHQLRHVALLDEVRIALRDAALSPRCLVLEITENVLIHDVEATIDTLLALKAVGVSLAIDDFGTGYSSLKYLHQFPVDVLKVDRSFVPPPTSRSEDWAVAQAVMKLAETFGLQTLAEGIEHAEQADLLRGMSCRLGQGYYFAEPLSADDLEALLGRERSGGPAFGPLLMAARSEADERERKALHSSSG